MDPQPRKKRQAQNKKKSKGPTMYSGKHIRVQLDISSKNSHPSQK